jgi:uridine kinase
VAQNDFKVFLHIDFDEVIRRALVRDLDILADRVIERCRNKYLPAQQIYMEQCHPAERADLLIDNTDWRNPSLSTDS